MITNLIDIIGYLYHQNDNTTLIIMEGDFTWRSVLATKASTTGPRSPCSKCTSSIINNFTNCVNAISPERSQTIESILVSFEF